MARRYPFDIRASSDQPGGWTKKCVYRIEGDKLTVCWRVQQSGGPRLEYPERFTARNGEDTGVAVYRRLSGSQGGAAQDGIQSSTLFPEGFERQLARARALEKRAEEHIVGSVERKQGFLKAAGAYETIFQRYRSRFAGLYARLHQGNNLRRAGQNQEASKVFQELFRGQDKVVAARLKAMAEELFEQDFDDRRLRLPGTGRYVDPRGIIRDAEKGPIGVWGIDGHNAVGIPTVR